MTTPLDILVEALTSAATWNPAAEAAPEAVLWCDAGGDGRWVVAIRGATLAADRRSAVATAGGGIVAESDADDEVAETTTKFRTVLSALGVSL